jgi:hypothetical protein
MMAQEEIPHLCKRDNTCTAYVKITENSSKVRPRGQERSAELADELVEARLQHLLALCNCLD